MISALKIYRDAVWEAEHDEELDPELREEVALYYAESAAKYLGQSRAIGFVGLEEQLGETDWSTLGAYSAFSGALEQN